MQELNLGRTIREQVREILKQRILSSEPGYRPGDKLVISDVCRGLGISPTPLKQALARLERDGLVEIRPRRGTYIAKLSYEDLFEVVEVLRGLELLSIDLCGDSFSHEALRRMSGSIADAERSLEEGLSLDYARVDKEFHSSLVMACGNKWLAETYANLYLHTEVRLALYSRVEENVRSSLEDHKSMLEVLRNSDKTEAKNAISAHWDNAQERLLRTDPLSLAQTEEV